MNEGKKMRLWNPDALKQKEDVQLVPSEEASTICPSEQSEPLKSVPPFPSAAELGIGDCDGENVDGKDEERQVAKVDGTYIDRDDEAAEAGDADEGGGGSAGTVTEASIEAALMGSLLAETSETWLQEYVGVPLTEENLLAFQKKFNEMNKHVHGKAKPDHDLDEMVEKSRLTKNEMKNYEALKNLLAEGKFPSKSSQGNRFRKALTDEEKAEYDAMGVLDGEAYRLEWAKKEFDMLENKKEHTTEWKETKTHTFDYLTFGGMVLLWGGWSDPAAIQGAVVASLRCLAMGEPWIWEHPQSGMTEFSIVKRSAQETFSRSWAEKVTEWSNFSQDPQGAVAVPQTSLAAGLAQQQILPVAAQLQTTAAEAQKQAADAKKAAADAKKKALAKAKAGGRKAEGDAAVVGGDAVPNAKVLNKMIADAYKLRAEIMNTSHRGLELLQLIDADASWAWAKQEKGPKLKSLLEGLKNEFSPWATDFMLHDTSAAQLKKNTTSERLLTEIKSLLALKKDNQDVENFITALLDVKQKMPV